MKPAAVVPPLDPPAPRVRPPYVVAVVVGRGRTEVVTLDALEAGRWERELSSVRRALGVL